MLQNKVLISDVIVYITTVSILFFSLKEGMASPLLKKKVNYAVRIYVTLAAIL